MGLNIPVPYFLFGSRSLRPFDYRLLSRLWGKTLTIPEGKKKGFVLSFDVETWDGKCGGTHEESANPEEEYFGYLQRLLAVLEKHNTKAQFFVCGKVLELYSAAFDAVVRKGHGVGGHGYKHEVMSTLSDKWQRKIVGKVKSLTYEKLGVEMKSWRCPWTVSNIHTYKVLREFGIRFTSNNRAVHKPFSISGVLDIPVASKFDGEILGWANPKSTYHNSWTKYMKEETSSKGGILVFGMHTWVQRKYDPDCSGLESFLNYLKPYRDKVWLGSFDDLQENNLPKT